MAFRSFFERRGRYPRFKKRGVARDSFCAANQAGTFRVEGRRIHLPRIGWVRMREALRFSGKPKRVTVSREAGRWFASVLVETCDIGMSLPPRRRGAEHPRDTVGVDLGVKVLAVLSTGETIPGPKAHKRLLAALRRGSRELSRKRKGSVNRRKAQARLARLHARIANIRRDAAHKATTMLAKTYRLIAIEDLNVRGMASNRRLARSIMDGGFGMFRRQLEYKASLYGSTVVLTDRWYPSSRTCSPDRVRGRLCCGSVKAGLALSERVFRCDSCGFTLDRDWNAARNLEKIAASSAVTICGGARSSPAHMSRVKPGSGKQKRTAYSVQFHPETASYA